MLNSRTGENWKLRFHHKIMKQRNVGFSYLLTLTAVSFTRFAWLPWLAVYLHQRKYNSWTGAVSAYGILLSSFQLGQYLGHLLIKSKKFSNSWFTLSFIFLTGSFIAVCFVSRFTVMLALFFTMGMSGTILSGVSISIDKNTPSLAFLRQSNEAEKGNNLERNLICFSFITLLVGYLFDSDPLAQFPMYYLSLLLVCFCLLVFLYYILMSRTISMRGKSITSNRLGVSSYGSSNNSHSNSKNIAGLVGGNHTRDGNATTVVTNYHGPVPANFLSACSNNLTQAQAMYGKMLEWRKRYHMDTTFFETPQNHFHAILQYYPHAIHGYSLDGCAVVYEILGRGDPHALARVGVTLDDLVWHFTLRNELVFSRLLDPVYMQSILKDAVPGAVAIPSSIASENKSTNDDPMTTAPVRKLMTVLDVKGIGITSVTTDVISFIMKSGEFIDNYYPQQVSRLVVCNAPVWFSSIWSVIASVLPKSVQQKVDILYNVQGLDRYIHPSQRPELYGGTDRWQLGEASGHVAFLALEEKWRTSIAATTAISRQQATDSTSSIQQQQQQLLVNSSGGDGSKDGRKNSIDGSSSNISNTSNSSSGSNSNTTANLVNNITDWFRKRFQTIPSAYLGEKNSYRYNPITGLWNIDADLVSCYEEDNDEEGADYHDINETVLRHRSSRDMEGGGSSSSSNSSGMYKSPQQKQLQSSSSSSNNNSNSNIGGNTRDRSNSRSMNNNSNSSSSGRGTPSKGTPNTTTGNNNSGNNTSGNRVVVAQKVKMSQDQLEEHGLVLAIQAAHLAAKFKNRQTGKLSSSSQDGGYQGNSSNNNNSNTGSNDDHNYIGNSSGLSSQSRDYQYNNYTNNNNNSTADSDDDNDNGEEYNTITSSHLIENHSSDYYHSNNNYSNNNSSSNSRSSNNNNSSNRSNDSSSGNKIYKHQNSSSGSRSGNKSIWGSFSSGNKRSYNTSFSSSNNNSSSSNNNNSVALAKISSHVFLLVVTLYIFCLWVQTALFTLIPVWMVIPISAGGLDYTVSEVSFVLSSAAMIVLILRNLMNNKYEHILKASPVRTMRIGCGLLLSVLFLLPWIMGHHQLTHINSSAAAAAAAYRSGLSKTTSGSSSNTVSDIDTVRVVYVNNQFPTMLSNAGNAIAIAAGTALTSTSTTTTSVLTSLFPGASNSIANTLASLRNSTSELITNTIPNNIVLPNIFTSTTDNTGSSSSDGTTSSTAIATLASNIIPTTTTTATTTPAMTSTLMNVTISLESVRTASGTTSYKYVSIFGKIVTANMPFSHSSSYHADQHNNNDYINSIMMNGLLMNNNNNNGGSSDTTSRGTNTNGIDTKSADNAMSKNTILSTSSNDNNNNNNNHRRTSSRFLYFFPEKSLLAMQLPAFLLAVLVCAVQLCRRASSILLHLTLSATFHSPLAVRYAINAFVDVGGPLLACFLFSYGYSFRLRYPMDAACFFSLAACIVLLVYIGSIFLTVQFRGDYGVMTDYQNTKSSTSSSGTYYPLAGTGALASSGYANNNNTIMDIESAGNNGSSMDGKQLYQRNNNNNNSNTSSSFLSNTGGDNNTHSNKNASSSLLSMCYRNNVNGSSSSNNNSNREDLLCIPLGDINLLLSSSWSGYGSKLYNLKDDFKDL